MKRVISMILVVLMSFGAMSSLSSCMKTKRVGTEGAKLLLANERFDEEIVGSKIDIGLDSILSDVADAQIASISNVSNVITPKIDALREPTVSSLISDISVIPEKIWSEFSAYNQTLSQFDSFIINIENYAASVAEDIAVMKNKVGIVDKWVQIGLEKHMLRVYDNKDMLIVSDPEGDVNVYSRYTDESANNIYEMYSFINYEDGESGRIRMLFIPEQCYEYQFIHSSGFEDYVTIENSRGYWMLTRYNYSNQNEEEHINIFPLIIKDGFCAATSLRMDRGIDGIQIGGYSVVDLQSGCEVLTISNDYKCVSLHISGVKEGLLWIGSDEYNQTPDGYINGALNSFKTPTGVYTVNEEDLESDFRFSYGHVEYDAHFDQLRGTLDFVFNKELSGSDEAVILFEAEMESIGITLHRDAADISYAIKMAESLASNFGDIYSWNGYNLNSLENIRAARGSFIKDCDDAYLEYESVKNYASAVRGLGGVNLSSFASLDNVIMGQNSYSDGYINIEGISAALSNSDLLELGKEYILKVALSLCDNDGDLISVNTVALGGGAQACAVAFNGDSMLLNVSGQFCVPKNLISGDYALVVYAATADEEIRVTDMVKVASFSSYEGNFDSQAMDISVKTINGNLHVRYDIKNSITLNLISLESGYTLENVERIITIEVLKNGAPFAGAELECADGTKIDGKGALGSGSYRMMCYLNTSDGLAQSYIYVNIN